MAEYSKQRGAGVVIEALAKRYGEVEALAPTDLTVQSGEFFSLIGPSGSGKSTLLGCIAGFVPPSAGRILVNGADIVAVPPYRRNIGMVFQNYSLFPHMSVAENIAFPLRMRKLPPGEIAGRVERILSVVRLPGMGDRAPSQLSGGQQQRVALARAAVYDPPLLLMDEPLGALDKNLREEMQYEIKQFHRAIGATVLYVTHDQEEAATMSDRIAILNHGRIEQAGEPRALYEQPRNAFVASFLGDANLFEVRRVDGAIADRIAVETSDGLRLVATHAPVTVARLVACIRPEAIRLGNDPERTGETNVIDGVVADVVHAAGSVRTRVSVGDRLVTVRAATQRNVTGWRVGEAVRMAWHPRDTLLIPKE
ncbi:MAG: ABC transporter ATP-binding protein [Alphaproteobacteria bacterium]|nr:ABC transporter ATP-binding protein [Alphaproteobacteria bacterium]